MIPQAGLGSSFGLLMCPSILLWALEGLWAPMIQFGLSQWNEAAGEGSWGGRRERERGGRSPFSLPQLGASSGCRSFAQ